MAGKLSVLIYPLPLWIETVSLATRGASNELVRVVMAMVVTGMMMVLVMMVVVVWW